MLIDVPAIQRDLLHVRVLYADETEIAAWWNERGVRSPFWRWYVNMRDGAAVRLADGSLYPLPAGHVHLIPAWIRFDLVNRDPIEHRYASFELVGLSSQLSQELFPAPSSHPFTPLLRHLVEACHAALKGARSASDPAACFAQKAAIDTALALRLAALPAAAFARLGALLGPDSPVAPALRHIDEHLGQPLAVPGLARRCGFARDHFARVFRRHTGQSPARYVLERRIAAAARRLALSDERIDDIAVACGFPDRFYFTRVFTRRMGAPPAAYRRSQPRPRPRDAASR